MRKELLSVVLLHSYLRKLTYFLIRLRMIL
nr:MAG TPA: hypothetical protein [Caudoviricetes sp.]